MTTSSPALLITGSSGRVGGLLRAALPDNRLAGLSVLWHARRPGPGVSLAWDIGHQPPPALPPGLIVLHLAGRTSGDTAALASNALSARAICAWARDRGAQVLLMSSAAVYAPAPHDLSETDAPAPPSPYGQAKLDAERAARDELPSAGLTALRLANLAGADALFGNIRLDSPMTLDPVAGQRGGPLRSYIGPQALAHALGGLIGHLRAGRVLPPVLNLAQPGAVAMADILQAAGAQWSFGPPRAAVIPRVTLSVARLQALVPLAPATARGLLDDLAALTGGPA